MASAYLEKTFANNGNRKTMTFSFWMKVAKLDTNMYPMSILDSSSGNQADIRHSSANQLRMYATGTDSTARLHLVTTRVFRDTNSWYHIVWQVDTTQATESNRVKLYVNGVQETSFGTETYPPQNIDLRWNGNNNADQGGVTQVGAVGGGGHWDGQLAHFHFIDGTAYPASTFGETDATTGIWKPKTAPSVTYGTNGFFLKFDNSANMGLDSSGQSNNFTTTGTIIQTKDTPSNVFAKINLLDNYYNGQASGSLSVINTKIQTAGSGTETYTLSTLGASKGKYYCEMKLVSSTAAHQTRFGIAYESSNGTADWLGKRAVGWSLRQDGTPTNNNSTISGTFASYTAGDIVSMAVDLDNSKLYFRKNNDAWMNSGDPTSGSTGTGAISITAGETYLIGIGDETGGYSVCELNFGDGYFGTTAVASAENPDDGNGIFEYDVPAGYRALCTKSINAEEYS
jgi:hypothetical protein